MLDQDRFVVDDAAWEKVAPLLAGKPTDPGATGKDNRLFLEAVLWRVRMGGHHSLMVGVEIKPSVILCAATMGTPAGSWFSPRSA